MMVRPVLGSMRVIVASSSSKRLIIIARPLGPDRPTVAPSYRVPDDEP